MAASVAHFISFEVGGFFGSLFGFAFVANFWSGALISVLRIEAVIYVAREMFVAVKPGAPADEDSASKPFWSVVAVGCASVRRVVIVAIGAVGGDSDVDCDLSFRVWSAGHLGSGQHQIRSDYSGECKVFELIHKSSSGMNSIKSNARLDEGRLADAARGAYREHPVRMARVLLYFLGGRSTGVAGALAENEGNPRNYGASRIIRLWWVRDIGHDPKSERI